MSKQSHRTRKTRRNNSNKSSLQKQSGTRSLVRSSPKLVRMVVNDKGASNVNHKLWNESQRTHGHLSNASHLQEIQPPKVSAFYNGNRSVNLTTRGLNVTKPMPMYNNLTVKNIRNNPHYTNGSKLNFGPTAVRR
jgi:hypothetical protein